MTQTTRSSATTVSQRVSYARHSQIAGLDIAGHE